MIHPSLASDLLQVVSSTITNTSSTTTSSSGGGRSAPVTFGEIAVALIAIVVFGTAFSRLVERVSRRAGASKGSRPLSGSGSPC